MDLNRKNLNIVGYTHPDTIKANNGPVYSTYNSESKGKRIYKKGKEDNKYGNIDNVYTQKCMRCNNMLTECSCMVKWSNK